MTDNIDYRTKKAEKAISSITAKVADANDISEEINCLSHLAEEKLVSAQEELSELYMAVDDDAPEKDKKPAKKPVKKIPAKEAE